MLRRLIAVLLLALAAGCDQRLNLQNARPRIEAEPATLDFGSTAPGVKQTRTVSVKNTGSAVLKLQRLYLTGDAVTVFSLVQPAVLEVAAQNALAVELSYLPPAEGNYAARLIIESDAENAAEISVSLSGVAFSQDPCAHVSCNSPPGPCFVATGSCSGGACSYAPKADDVVCDDGDGCTDNDRCRAGACAGTPKQCIAPPAAMCTGPNSFVSFGSPGSCVMGACQYPQVSLACPNGCDAGTCLPDPCVGVSCSSPPRCYGAGACVNGACHYAVTPGASCDDGNPCTDADACSATGGCSGAPKICQTPPAASCVDAMTERTFDPIGACAAGSCGYTSRDVSCALGCDAATGHCRTSCAAGEHPCGQTCVRDDLVASCGQSCTPCATPVNGMATCDGGACGVVCNAGAHLCNGQCVPDSSPASCGASCSACPVPANATATCDGTSCGFTCNAGAMLVNGRCCGTDMVSAGTFCIDKYEASAGANGAAVSVAGAAPWASLTHAQAQAACGMVGKHVCTEPEWQAACGGPAGLLYPYGNTYSANACNGLDRGNATGSVTILPTGSLSTCQGGYAGLFDMSGNVYERTDTCTGGNCRVKGGSYRSSAGAGLLRCNTGFDFGQGPDMAVGFRCCL